MENPLNASSQSCIQGVYLNDSWHCQGFRASHLVCGHNGVFSFLYPNFQILETGQNISMTVQRSGGGYGTVSINYYIRHITTNDSDVKATAFYTTSQKLVFEAG